MLENLPFFTSYKKGKKSTVFYLYFADLDLHFRLKVIEYRGALAYTSNKRFLVETFQRQKV